MSYTEQWLSGGASLEPALTDSRDHDEAVSREVEQLMAPGGEYHPWTPEHVAEAMVEIGAAMGSDVDRLTIHGQNKAACLAGVLLLSMIEGYWRRMATEQAEAVVELQARERRMPDPD